MRRTHAVVTLALLTLGLVVPGLVGHAQSGPDRRVVQAARRNDVEAVRLLVRQRADVNASEPDGSTPLLWAAFHSNADMARALVTAGARPNVQNRYGLTPLLQAARLGDTATVEALLKAGADPQLAHPDGETPLMGAAQSGRVEAVRLLLARGVDVNAMESVQGQTALMWAAGEGHLEVVSALLEAGARPNVVAEATRLVARRHADHPSGGLTALMFAARQGHTDVVRKLAEAGADLNVANPDGATALIIAIINDRFDTAGALIDAGANVNDGSLYHAVDFHNLTRDGVMNDPTRPRLDHPNTLTALDLVKKLLDKGADPNRNTRNQFHVLGNCCAPTLAGTPFFHAAERADVDVLKLMVAKGATVNPAPAAPPAAAADPDGGPQQAPPAPLTPLMAALNGGPGGRGGGPGDNRGGEILYREEANRSPVDAVKVLIDAGADVNQARADGVTPLHLAAQAGNLPMIQLLADSGAKLDAKAGRDGLTPLDYASGKAPAGPGRAGGPPPAPPPARPQAAALLRRLMGLPEQGN
jgi:ankyrin repeat protein